MCIVDNKQLILNFLNFFALVTTISNTISQTGEIAISNDGSICDDIFFMGQVRALRHLLTILNTI